MSLVVSSTKAILGTNDHGEIVFDSLSSGVKPLVFDSAESAWNTLEYVFPDKTIGYDKETDRAYEIVGKKQICFLAGLKVIKELVYTGPIEPKNRNIDSELYAIRRMLGDEALLKIMRENETI